MAPRKTVEAPPPEGPFRTIPSDFSSYAKLECIFSWLLTEGFVLLGEQGCLKNYSDEPEAAWERWAKALPPGLDQERTPPVDAALAAAALRQRPKRCEAAVSALLWAQGNEALWTSA